MKMKKKKAVLTSIGILAALAISGGVFAGVNVALAEKAESEVPTVIADSVTIGGIDVSGMTKDEADAAIRQLVENRAADTVTLTAGSKEINITAEEAGFSIANPNVTEMALLYGNTGNLLERYMDKKDIEAGNIKDFSVAYTADAAKISEFLSAHKAELETETVDNGLRRENGAFVFIEGEAGTELKVDESVGAVKSYFENDFIDGGEAKVALETDVDEPKGTKEELSAVKDTLGTYSTYFGDSDAGRAQNVRRGAELVNGVLLYPGETISIGDQTNPCTVENGYAEASAYENGEVVQSVGGGICQVSTTLYNAVIRAELEVVERYAHSMTVTYVKPSMDAALADGVKDFQFKNNQDTPIYVEMLAEGGYVYATVYGKETRNPNRTVDFESEVTETIEPTIVLNEDGALPVGTVTRTSQSPHTGYTARLWKIVKVNGVEQSREIFNNSKYRATNDVYSVGTQCADAELSELVRLAIASGDLQTVRDASAQAAATVEQQAAEAAEQAAQAESDDSKKKDGSDSRKKSDDSDTKKSGD